MTADLFLILNNEVKSGKLTEEQSKIIGERYLDIQAFEWATEMEKSEFFKAFIAQVVYPDGDPEMKAWQEAGRKDTVKLLEKIEGQQTLFTGV